MTPPYPSPGRAAALGLTVVGMKICRMRFPVEDPRFGSLPAAWGVAVLRDSLRRTSMIEGARHCPSDLDGNGEATTAFCPFPTYWRWEDGSSGSSLLSHAFFATLTLASSSNPAVRANEEKGYEWEMVGTCLNVFERCEHVSPFSHPSLPLLFSLPKG